MRLVIASAWDGAAVGPEEYATVEVTRSGASLCVDVEAPFYDDPAPDAPPGPTPALWNFEVVELMLLGAEEKYLELEFGPHGHYLALQLAGRRAVQQSGMELSYRSEVRRGRFRAQASFPRTWLPMGCDRVNAFAMHGCGDARRFLAFRGAPGTAPDFHRLELFAPLSPLV